MGNWFSRLFTGGQVQPAGIPALTLAEFRSAAEYREHCSVQEPLHLDQWLMERALVPADHQPFTLSGFCHVCREESAFDVDFLYSHAVNGVLTPNWRERLVCPGCRLNNRTRAVVQILDEHCRPGPRARIYITEQLTPLYERLLKLYPGLIGSEYLGAMAMRGGRNSLGIRHEDLTALSFTDNELDFILSFDVFEHIADFRRAFAECHRSLKPGGTLFFSVPFLKQADRNLVRATVSSDGEITHLHPAEYHGDPINSDGCLCFYHFGWEMLDDLKAAGFGAAHAVGYWSRELGYLGGEQLMFMATKD